MPLLIAVDLGSHSAKVTTFRSAGRKVELEDRFIFPVPQDGSIPTLRSRVLALEALADDNPGWLGGTAVIGLCMSTADVSFHPVELPFTDRSQVEKTLPFTIESEVPFDLDDMALGWRTTKLDGKSRVMTVLTREDALRPLLTTLKTLGMDPAVVVPDGEVLAEFAPQGSYAVIDVGHTHTIVSVVIDGEVRASRAVSVGGYHFTLAIQHALECDWQHAEALKHGQIVDVDATDGGNRVASGYSRLPAEAKTAVDGAIGQLLAEVRSTLIRYEDELGVDVQAVKLTGGSSRIPELWDYFAGDLGVPVEPCSDGAAVPETHAASHGLGRVLGGLSAVKPVDLRVGEFAFRGGTNVMRTLLTYGTVAGVFFAVAAMVIFGIEYTRTLKHRSDLNEAINQVVRDTIPTVSEDDLATRQSAELAMLRETVHLENMSKTLPPANPEKPATIDRIYALTNAMPPHEEVPVELTSLEMLKELTTFEGETDGFTQSAKIEEVLRATPGFERATKDSESRTNNGKMRFKFSIPIGEPKKEEG